MSDNLDLVFRAPRVITAAGEVARCVGVRDGRIVTIEPIDAELDADQIVDLGHDEVLIPGLVDTHVHVNEPGRTEWEGFASATRAAAAGGITTIVDMPLNSIPPTVNVEALQVKRRVAADQAYVDVGFWGGAVPGNVPDLRALHDAGVFGFKCFLLHSGVDEFPPLDPDGLELALKEIASFGALMIVHAEDAHAIDRAASPGGDNYADFLSSRPRGAENLAIAEVIELSRWTGCRVHILHLSSSDALPMIASARRDGVKLTAETCPHYLSFVSEEIPAGATQFKCCPPIREAANRELLWQGLVDGVIDCIVTDHSPCTADLKRFDIGDFGVAWGGIASLQVSLSAVWSEAKRRGYSLNDVVRWMAENPARQVGLNTKGHIALGYAADFAVFAPDDAFVVDAKTLQHKNPVSAYDQRALAGVVRSTWLAGKRIDLDEEPRGRLLSRGMA
ncbi:allantoinase AllB [Mycolicibacterium brisbanense]|uniref:allantoinase n=1 Tax=Mycolicibacterium brisbanense TaxID=146020 RepID=A0A100W0P1_9MYCO|nr:allantoinase AllB [Mycolicibacterium brisbanense]MCV7155875.1 allantoinase AllB [Mycolicibacterium brisbanense]GAS89487.1 allantoinase [Mycolicibacterium brisbanense]